MFLIVRCLSYNEKECVKTYEEGNSCFWLDEHGICKKYPSVLLPFLLRAISNGACCIMRPEKLLKMKIYSKLEYEMEKILKRGKE